MKNELMLKIVTRWDNNRLHHQHNYNNNGTEYEILYFSFYYHSYIVQKCLQFFYLTFFYEIYIYKNNVFM